jgi:hypothetical protein
VSALATWAPAAVNDRVAPKTSPFRPKLQVAPAGEVQTKHGQTVEMASVHLGDVSTLDFRFTLWNKASAWVEHLSPGMLVRKSRLK